MRAMRLRDALEHELARGFGTHHQDPVVQQIAGLRRVGAAVYDLEQDVQAAEKADPAKDLRRARCYFAGCETLVTFADAFVLDAFADPDHPRHLPHVTFLQAQAFYLKVPDLVTAVRQELAYPGSARLELPVLPGPRFETERCPVEHLLAMQRAAQKVEDLIGTRIETLKLHATGTEEPRGLKPAVLAMAAARTKREAADQVIGALRAGQRVPAETHEEAERLYYDGVLRQYLYAAQELELVGVTAAAPDTEEAPEPEPASPRPPQWQQGPAGPWAGTGGGFGGGLGGGFGQLLAADVVGNLIGGMLGGMFGGGMLGGGGMFGGGGRWW
jgi:hypothetical protein